MSQVLLPAEVLVGHALESARRAAKVDGQLVPEMLDGPAGDALLHSLLFAQWPARLGELEPRRQLYNRYFWFVRFAALWTLRHDPDVGVAQQTLQLLEGSGLELDMRVVEQLELQARMIEPVEGHVIEPLPFWSAERPPATEKELDDTERHVGHALPTEFRDLLLIQNGGIPNYGGFQEGQRFVPLMNIAAAGTTTRLSLTGAADIRELEGRPAGVLLVGAEAHSWLGLDYRRGVEPAVVLGNTDEDDVKLIAPSFAAFLAGVVEEMPAKDS